MSANRRESPGHGAIVVLAAAVGGWLVAACTMTLQPEDEALQHGNYRVLDTYEGIAGIYGHGLSSARGHTPRAGFHGRTNDLGETWDPKRLTVAHHSWPIGTLVRLTHLENEFKAVARVADRVDRFGKARLCDVSPGLAAALDFGYLGRAPVRVELLAPLTGDTAPAQGAPAGSLPEAGAPPPAQAGRFALLCGELDDRAQAEAMAREIGKLVEPAWVEPQGERFRVLAGAAADRAQADALAEKVRTQGYEARVIER